MKARPQDPEWSGDEVAHADMRVGRRRLSDEQVLAILANGRNAMPAIAIPDGEKRALLDFLFEREGPNAAQRPDLAAPDSYEASGFARLLDDQGYPGTKPSWGTLNAIDLNTGKLVWKVPLREYDELLVPKTGTENFGGAMATGGGHVFCAGTHDLRIRAFDKADGRGLWSHILPFGGFAPPATYQVNGR
jgi:quinoprotein glucose dehydrogenase